MLKDLLALVDADAAADVAGSGAISLAAALGAHVTGVVQIVDLVPANYRSMLPAEVIAAAGARDQERAGAAAERFLRDARLAGAVAETVTLEGAIGAVETRFSRLARHFDLLVMPQADPAAAGNREVMIEGALFHSGRPVLVVPYIQREPMNLERALVAWDGSRSAARAVGDALPLLVRAHEVQVVAIKEGKADPEGLAAFDMGRHLARHGIAAEVKRITPAGDIAATLLSYADDMRADYIVMGGYGHSRLREFILGGATRGMLHAMTTPVLMAH